MNPIQQHFVQWLLHSTHLIPVTARSAEALSRVHLPFQYGAVCSHGGTVLNADFSKSGLACADATCIGPLSSTTTGFD
jgi:hypothetical protein